MHFMSIKVVPFPTAECMTHLDAKNGDYFLVPGREHKLLFSLISLLPLVTIYSTYFNSGLHLPHFLRFSFFFSPSHSVFCLLFPSLAAFISSLLSSLSQHPILSPLCSSPSEHPTTSHSIPNRPPVE